MDEQLFAQFEKHFSLLDSLIFNQEVLLQHSTFSKTKNIPKNPVHNTVDCGYAPF